MVHSTVRARQRSTSDHWGNDFLPVVLCLAFALRLAYFFHVNRIVDEYISMLSIRAILKQGVPILPSGWFYGPKGLLHGYLGALFALLFGRSELAFCFQSVAAGVIAVAYVYRVGRDWFSPAVGTAAAVALACLPSAVQWGGRIRMYSLWQLLCLVGIYLLVDGYLRELNRRRRIVGLLVLSLAMLTHTLTLIVLVGLAVGVGVAWLASPSRSRPSISPSRWEVMVIIFLAGLVVLLDPLSGPWGGRVKMSEVAQGALTIQLVWERLLYLLVYTREFVTWPLWPLTVFYAVGFIRLMLRLAKRRFTSEDWVALALYILIGGVWFVTAIMSHIQRDRYLFAIIPLFLLLALRESVSMVELLVASWRPWAGSGVLSASGVVSVMLIGLLVPSTIWTIHEDASDLALAYRYVRDHWRASDAIAACHPAPSEWFLDRVDYYAIEIYVGVRDGIDVWAGAPLVETPEKFAAALDDNERVWYVADELCWTVYLGPDFRQFVQRNMSLALDRDGVRVFVSGMD